MDSAPNTLPTGVTELTELVLTLQARLTHQDAFIEQLLEQIRLARHRHFGARSEKFSVDQMTLPFDEDVTGKKGIPDSSSVPSTDDADTEDTEADQITVGPYQRKAGGHRRLPPELPRIEIRYALERSDCQCGRCHGALQPIAEQVSEQLDIVPARVQVLRHDRLQYGCPKCEGEIKVATMPDQPIPKGLASPGTLSHIAVAKYRDGLPLYRPVQQLNRIGLEIPRSTLASWMIQSGKLVQPLINLLRDRLLAYDIISMDETRLQVLKEPGRTAQSQSYLWVQRGGPPDSPIPLYDYDPSRGQSVPMRLLSGYQGYLQTDCYEGYGQIIREQALTAVDCWAHVRRKFDEAIKAQPKIHRARTREGKLSLAQQGRMWIWWLYRIERQVKSMMPAARHELRQRKSQPVIDELRDWLTAHLPLVPPKSALGKAMQYLHKQWPKLITYLEDGRLRIDNDLTENAIRPFVVGRKNFLFCDSVAGANASANLYT